VEVASVDASFSKALELGGKAALPRMPVPGVGWLGYVKDPGGNILGLMQPDPAAR
jgi:predicted enzyme related to lactoylglutathione lyase